MGTCVEGDWEDLLDLLTRCFRALEEVSDRVSVSVKFVHSKGRSGRLAGKIESVESTLEGNVDLLVVVSPFIEGPNAIPLSDEIGPALQAAEISWVDLNTRIEPTPEMYVDHIHLSTLGHAHVGEELAGIIEKRLLN